MDRMKQFARYILMIIGLYFFTAVLVFIGFNVNYSDINLNGNKPEQITIKKAEATKHEGRVYGYISNDGEIDINGKYIKILVYDSKNEILTTEFLKINGVERGKDRMFKSKFVADGIKNYSINIVDQIEI